MKFKVLAVLLLISLTGCRQAVPRNAPGIRKYAMRGEVVKVDMPAKTAVIKSEKIEGWMEAMTMEFPIRNAAELEKLSPGKQITATVYVKDLDFWLDDVAPAK